MDIDVALNGIFWGVLAVAAFGLSLWGIISIVKSHTLKARLQYGEETQAVVTKRYRTTGRNASERMIFNYTVDGKIYEYGSSIFGLIDVGDKLDIVYDPLNPAKYIFKGRSNKANTVMERIGFVASTAVFLVGVWCTGLAFGINLYDAAIDYLDAKQNVIIINRDMLM